MKQFLYLVQSRKKFVKKNLELESARSDVLILTFDKKIQGDNFLYGPDTIWPEGRNMLIEKARNLMQKYDYYIMLDDDIEFNKGSFHEFEDEVLKLQPDHCMPFYLNPPFAEKIYKMLFFDYTIPVIPDCCFDCLSQKLFFDDNLLPYQTDFSKMTASDNKHRPTIYCNDLYLNKLNKDFRTSKILVINKFSIMNTVSDTDYDWHSINADVFYEKFLSPAHKQNIKKHMPIYFFYQFLFRKYHKYGRLFAQFRKVKRSLSVREYLAYLIRFLFTSQTTMFQKMKLIKTIWIYFVFAKLHIHYLYWRFRMIEIFWSNFKLNRLIRSGKDWSNADL